MQRTTRFTLLALSAAVLAGCGSSNNSGTTINSSPAPGQLEVSNPLRVVSLTASDFNTQLQASATGQGLAAAAGGIKCGFDLHYLQYGTTGGAGELTTASGALMIPTGSSPGCSGPRPILLYAHGTNTSRNYNLAALTDSTNPAYSEAVSIAAMFAAQGYIVVAPNYAGYDSSSLSYHPYLDAAQQSAEMVDILSAARTALPGTYAGASTSDNGKLFVTGYSQGGHVAMATLQYMQNHNMTVTAGAPMSGPYAMELFGDAIFGGTVNVGGTLFAPLLSTSYQKAYGNVYSTPSDLYTTEYASGIESLLPGSLSVTQLFTENKLPQSALFQSAPTGISAIDSLSPPSSDVTGFGFAASNYLVQSSYRAAYLADAQANPDQVTAKTGYLPAASPAFGLRQDLKINDLRGFAPTMPVLMCGGDADPTVFFPANATPMYGAMGASGATQFGVVDVDSNNNGGTALTDTTLNSTLTTAQQTALATAVGTGEYIFGQGYQGYYQPAYTATYNAAYQADIAKGDSTGTATTDATTQATIAAETAIDENYHGSIVPPACMAVAQGFFNIYNN